VVCREERVHILLGKLSGGVRATSVYNGDGLDGAWILDSWV
jgi:hypothetical protein